MLFIYGIISLLYIVFLFGVGYYFNKCCRKVKKSNDQFKEAYTILIPFKNEHEKIHNMLKCIDQEGLAHLQKVILVDDCSESFSLEYQPKNIKIELVSLKNNVGKTQAIKEGLSSVESPFVCILDADLFWEKSSFKNLVEGNLLNIYQLNILPLEEMFNQNKWLQFEEMAIKSVTYAAVGAGKPVLMSSAALFGKKSLVDQLIKNYSKPHGWDMYLLKSYAKNLHWVFPAQNRTLKTNAKKNYIKYVKQRARWVNNSFRNPSLTLFLVGFFVFLSFSFDLISFFSFFFLPDQLYFYLMSIFVIKTISSIIVVKSTEKHFSSFVHPLQILLSHFIYGLNIGIILIFLVLLQIKERKF